MEEIVFKPGMKFYYYSEDLKFHELIFKRIEGKSYYFFNQYDEQVRFNKSLAHNILNVSRIMVLTDLEEKLSERIKYIHDQMSRHKIKFNPVTPFDIVYKDQIVPVKEVHQYSLTGLYIDSYPSVKSASEIMGRDRSSSSISKCCKGKLPTAFGYLWSYNKQKKLEIKNRNGSQSRKNKN